MRDQIWQQCVEQSGADFPNVAIVKQLIEESKTTPKAKENESSPVSSDNEPVKVSKNVDDIFCSIAKESNENQLRIMEKIGEMIRARNNDETGLSQLSLEELNMLSIKLNDLIFNQNYTGMLG